MNIIEKPSKLDASINYLINGGLEARFVQRNPEQVIVYLSSQYGCDQACRICHLTQMGQISNKDTTDAEFELQMRTVLQAYFTRTQVIPKSINFNYMAKGELLLNQHRRLMRGEEVLDIEHMSTMIAMDVFGEHGAAIGGKLPLLNQYVSTIFPSELLTPIPDYDNPITLYELVDNFRTTFFYSLYSLDPTFRKRWLPKAMDPSQAIEFLWDYSNYDTNPTPVIHHALIEGENDTEEEAYRIAQFMEVNDVEYRVNLVRYNPFGPGQGKEPNDEQYERVAEVFRDSDYCERVQIVPRVGQDCAASCGQFINL